MSYAQQPSSSKPSVMKSFKNLIRPSKASLPSPPAPDDTRRRRAEALQACGLLQQSKIYGRGPYRDEEGAPEKSTREEAEEEEGEKCLIKFDDETQETGKHALDVAAYKAQFARDDGVMSEDASSPAPPYPPVPPYSPPHRACASLPREPLPVRLRRRDSLADDVARIEDAESRRLTELAFLR
ncbi:hypothetical protein DFH11DRAFT_1541855 [Phellopilus nigrolimitatus]|nr:hypothetical protein DFH11DRAFT_1541855 [Phellopilus nigrolimitatus]